MSPAPRHVEPAPPPRSVPRPLGACYSVHAARPTFGVCHNVHVARPTFDVCHNVHVARPTFDVCHNVHVARPTFDVCHNERAARLTYVDTCAPGLGSWHEVASASAPGVQHD